MGQSGNSCRLPPQVGRTGRAGRTTGLDRLGYLDNLCREGVELVRAEEVARQPGVPGPPPGSAACRSTSAGGLVYLWGWSLCERNYSVTCILTEQSTESDK